MDETIVRFTEIPVIFSEKEVTGPPALPGLVLHPKVSTLQRPKQLFAFNEWKGLLEESPFFPEPPLEPTFVTKVTLPSGSSKIIPIKERRKPVSFTSALRQEQVMHILGEIEVVKLEASIRYPKGGYQLPDLKTFAKQLGVPTTDLRKAGMARRILEKIKLKEKD